MANVPMKQWHSDISVGECRILISMCAITCICRKKYLNKGKPSHCATADDSLSYDGYDFYVLLGSHNCTIPKHSGAAYQSSISSQHRLQDNVITLPYKTAFKPNSKTILNVSFVLLKEKFNPRWQTQ